MKYYQYYLIILRKYIMIHIFWYFEYNEPDVRVKWVKSCDCRKGHFQVKVTCHNPICQVYHFICYEIYLYLYSGRPKTDSSKTDLYLSDPRTKDEIYFGLVRGSLLRSRISQFHSLRW